MNKWDSSKQYKTTNKLNMFFTNKGVEIFNLPKILISKMFQPIRYKNLDHKSNLTNLNKQPSNKSYPRPIHSTMLLWKITIYRSGTWLQMVCNKKLMKLITKGIELRCWDKAKSSIIDGMNGTFNSFVTEAVIWKPVH